ncbi:hypothetical protein C8Q79DRAFT_753143 [Trametes meyenii]|nr:hypothetical protein C8Q79DRAFT_753143 [Trametes meyenii]
MLGVVYLSLGTEATTAACRREEIEACRSSEPSTQVLLNDASGEFVASSLTANIWKIKCATGDVVKTADSGDVLVILEAHMKTEVNVGAGDSEFIGRGVKGFGREVKQGSSVSAVAMQYINGSLWQWRISFVLIERMRTV